MSSAIKSVGNFQYGKNEGSTCDRCGAGIKNVFVVNYQDGTSSRYGSECIHKILGGDTSLVSLWKKNAKLLVKFQKHLEILSLPYEQMPVDARGYYGRGVYFVNDETGGSMCHSHMYFHPTKLDDHAEFDGSETFDMRACNKVSDKTRRYTAWERNTKENWFIKCECSIKEGREFLTKRIGEIETFLARILSKGIATAAQVEIGRAHV